MTLVNTYSYYKEVPRTYDKLNNLANVTVEEYKTFYSVTVHLVGYACPSVIDLRVSKKITNNPIDAALGIIKKTYINGII